MGRLTTHVLDTANGRPAAAVRIRVYRVGPTGERQLVREATTNADGRCDAPLLEDADFEVGVYELVFGAGAYFAAIGSAGPRPPFVGEVVLRRRRAALPRAAPGLALELVDVSRQLTGIRHEAARRRGWRAGTR
jgi:5-hydroxyisourate hydrolase